VTLTVEIGHLDKAVTLTVGARTVEIGHLDKAVTLTVEIGHLDKALTLTVEIGHLDKALTLIIEKGHLTEVLTLIMDKNYLAKIKDFIDLFPVHGEMYSIQHYVIKFVSDLRQVGGFLRVLRFPPPIKLTATI
jgi:hypothetical protein